MDGATKYIKLFDGNLVIDQPVPTDLLEKGNPSLKSEPEFAQMRYSAVTCDPDDFQRNKYTLRQALYGRSTKLFIVITMYNEGEEMFLKTFYGLSKNLAELCTTPEWGKEGWKEVVVCIVSDGRKKINQRTLSTIAALGVYQEGVAKNVVAGEAVEAHIYEYTTQSEFFIPTFIQ